MEEIMDDPNKSMNKISKDMEINSKSVRDMMSEIVINRRKKIKEELLDTNHAKKRMNACQPFSKPNRIEFQMVG